MRASGSASRTERIPATSRAASRSPAATARSAQTQAPGQDQGGLPLRGREIGVPGAQGQSVGLANERAGHDLDIEVEIGGHPLDDEDLLGILGSEKGEIGGNDVKKLEDDRRHAPKVPWPGPAAEPVLQALDLDGGPVARRVDLAGVGIEETIDAHVLQIGRVLLEVPGILLEVLVRSELGRVDEDADDGDIGPGLRSPDEAEMALVEIAHGRNEADLLSLPAPFAGEGLHSGDGLDERHLFPLPFPFVARLFSGASSAATSGLRW